MTTVRTRSAKGSALTHAELDANFDRGVNQKTVDYQLLVTDNRSTIECSHASTPITVTLINTGTWTTPEVGDFVVTITNINAAAVTVARAGTDTINGGTTNLTLEQNESVTLQVISAEGGWQEISNYREKLIASGDTATGDNAALGFTTTEGAILTGQGSTNDVTIKNDADAAVLEIPTGTTNVDIGGVVTGETFEPTGDTAAGDNAAIGYTASEGLILTGQGSITDVVIKNDADTLVMTIPTGGIDVFWAGDVSAGGNVITDTDSTNDIGSTGTRFANSYVDVMTTDNVVFPATQVPSADANTLDDYEEGTFTPTIQDTTLSDAEGQAYVTQNGIYTKIGRQVTFSLTVQWSTLGTLTGGDGVRISLGALPNSNSTQGGAMTVGSCSGLGLTAGDALAASMGGSVNYIFLYKWTATTGTAAATITDITDAGTLRLSGSYFV